jgi:uncharacterized protein Yka (UPF0111/DUF47 family)
MEYVVGPVLALLLGMKFSVWKADSVQKAEAEALQAAEARIEKLESQLDSVDQEMLKKVMTTVTPIAKAVVELNKQVGIQ